MHTFQTKNDTIFHFNSDGSGDVIIAKPEGHATKFDEVCVPFEDLLDFVGNFIRDETISKLEQMDAQELLGLIQSSPVPKFGKPSLCNVQLSRADSDLCVRAAGHSGEHRNE